MQTKVLKIIVVPLLQCKAGVPSSFAIMTSVIFNYPNKDNTEWLSNHDQGQRIEYAQLYLDANDKTLQEFKEAIESTDSIYKHCLSTGMVDAIEKVASAKTGDERWRREITNVIVHYESIFMLICVS